MSSKFTPIEDIQTRPGIHRSHFADNKTQNKNFFMMQLKAEKSTFPIIAGEGWATLLRPYEGRLPDNLDRVIDILKDEFVQVNTNGFLMDEITPYFNISFQQCDYPNTVYQFPLSSENYQKKLKKFKKSGFTFRELDESDIPELRNLINAWSNDKKERSLREFESSRITSSKDIEDEIVKLRSLQNEIEWLDHKDHGEDHYKTNMSQPLTTYFGTFKDGKLIAFTETESNNNFAAFNTRGSIRQNSFSPQEFLDYSIMNELVQKGVSIIDRGMYTVRDGGLGLLKYKEKFGPLFIHKEMNGTNVSVIKNPLCAYSKNLYGNAFTQSRPNSNK